MVGDCPRCGYHFEREEGFFLGAYVMNLGATQVAVVIYIGLSVVLTLPEPPLARLAVGGAVVALAVPLFAYPFSKTLWTAIDLIMHPAHMSGETVPAVRPGGTGPQ